MMEQFGLMLAGAILMEATRWLVKFVSEPNSTERRKQLKKHLRKTA